MATLQFLAALVSIAYLAHASGPTPIYINEVPEYSSLSTCVKNQVSVIFVYLEYPIKVIEGF